MSPKHFSHADADDNFYARFLRGGNPTGIFQSLTKRDAIQSNESSKVCIDIEPYRASRIQSVDFDLWLNKNKTATNRVRSTVILECCKDLGGNATKIPGWCKWIRYRSSRTLHTIRGWFDIGLLLVRSNFFSWEIKKTGQSKCIGSFFLKKMKFYNMNYTDSDRIGVLYFLDFFLDIYTERKNNVDFIS